MRKTIFKSLFNSIFLILFNLYFFLLGGSDHILSVWISYGFVHFSYFIVILTPYFVRQGSAAADYGRPLFVITTVHFYVSLLTAVVVFFILPANYIHPLLAHVTITAAFALVLFSNLITNERTADAVERREFELLYVKESSSKLKSILNNVSDSSLSKKIEKIYDLIHSSPIKSSAHVRECEQEVINQIQYLNVAVLQGERERILSISDKILILAEERNRLLKLSN